MKQINVILIGAGGRGTGYSKIMHGLGGKFRIVGVAEPLEKRRQHIQQLWELDDSVCVANWQDLLAMPKMADLAIVATMDDIHRDPALAAIEKGYHLLLEKPVAQTPEECAEIALAAREKGVHVLVCHVLRYNYYFKTLKKLLMDGVVGEIMSIDHVEAVGNVHQSHSYVRGNWHSEKETTPMLLAKSCHDIDMLQWLLGKPCRRVQSFGSLTYFTEKNAPAGAPARCTDGCPVGDTCPYNAVTVYGDPTKRLYFRNACAKGIAKGEQATNEEIMESLRTTNYGRCVFRSDNDVVDHQIVNMEFEGGTTVAFTMNAFNQGGRHTRVYGTRGEIYKNMGEDSFTLFDFETREKTVIPFTKREESIAGGHGGGDEGIVIELYDYLCGTYNGFSAADITISVKNHLVTFAAEESRRTGAVVSVDEYFSRFGFEND